jgi:hypothetical protein
MSEQPQLPYRHRFVPGINTLDVYLRHSGYEAFRKAVTMTPEAILEEMRAIPSEVENLPQALIAETERF